MAPFLEPTPVVSGIKERIDALHFQGDRLYFGSSTGNLHIYRVEGNSGKVDASLVEVKKGLTKRSIEQLGYVKDIDSLVVLSDATVSLYPLPTFSPPTILVKAKAAFSFAVHSSVQHIKPELKSASFSDDIIPEQTSIPMLVTQLLVGCRRKVVLYSWRDGEAQEVKEASLPHSARIISFLDHDTACFAYSPSDYVIFSLATMTTTDITTPLPVSTSSNTSAMGALTGLTGYMTLGLGSKPKPASVKISDGEVLIANNGQGFTIGPDAKRTRPATIDWATHPEELAYIKPYIISVLPPGSVTIPSEVLEPLSTGSSNSSQPNVIPTNVVQIRSAISLLASQYIHFHPNQVGSVSGKSGSIPSASIRLLTPSSPEKSPLYIISTPTDKGTATSDGSTIWQIKLRPWAEQIDDLIQSGQYTDALALLDTIEEAVLHDKDARRSRIRALNAVADFRNGRFDEAIDSFIELNLNPAKVVALYPEQVSGRLSVSSEGWIPLYGGPRPVLLEASSSTSSTSEGVDQAKDKDSQGKQTTTDVSNSLPIPISNPVHGKTATGLGTVERLGPPNEEENLVKSKKKLPDELHRSMEALLRYLSDRRPKLSKALEAVRITPEHQSHEIAPLSEVSIDDLFLLPNAPLTSLTPEQLLRCAQIVDTALFKSYPIIRPILLGSLCRLPNWCEVSEVEEDLRSRQKFEELIDLYMGKKMHFKALVLLKQLGEKEEDLEEKLKPSVRYLQKLGPEHLQQIFESSLWIFATDSNIAFEIFTSEDVDLPRQEVSEFLGGIDPKLSARYLEFIIEERHEQNPAFHDRLADLYLSMTLAAMRRGDGQTKDEIYVKLLQFISANNKYSVDRLYGALSSTELFEARAILLGRLGRHDQALELYVYRMQDYLKAEEYCKRVYHPSTETKKVFLTLLRLYLRPLVNANADLLTPALDLISKHSSRLDVLETLQLLPPLVTAQDIRRPLIEALRVPIFDTNVIRNISKARSNQLSQELTVLHRKRVKVTDSRICPQCHKRLGNSVIAVHAPRGEVTHYQCRELFSRRLKESRKE